MYSYIMPTFENGTKSIYNSPLMLIKPVSITDKALAAIKKIMSSKEIPDGYGIRIGLENMGASCGSTQYVLGFDHQSENDLAYEVNDVPVYIKKSEVLHVAGLKLDHVTEGEISGFLFEKAKS
jgi:iron-sulfur cluster assembly protein